MLHASLYTTSNSAYGNFDPPAPSVYTTSGTFLSNSIARKSKKLPDFVGGGNAIESNVKFINLGMRASAQNESVELKRWGLSGMAPFCF